MKETTTPDSLVANQRYVNPEHITNYDNNHNLYKVPTAGRGNNCLLHAVLGDRFLQHHEHPDIIQLVDIEARQHRKELMEYTAGWLLDRATELKRTDLLKTTNSFVLDNHYLSILGEENNVLFSRLIHDAGIDQRNVLAGTVTHQQILNGLNRKYGADQYLDVENFGDMIARCFKVNFNFYNHSSIQGNSRYEQRTYMGNENTDYINVFRTGNAHFSRAIMLERGQNVNIYANSSWDAVTQAIEQPTPSNIQSRPNANQDDWQPYSFQSLQQPANALANGNPSLPVSRLEMNPIGGENNFNPAFNEMRRENNLHESKFLDVDTVADEPRDARRQPNLSGNAEIWLENADPYNSTNERQHVSHHRNGNLGLTTSSSAVSNPTSNQNNTGQHLHVNALLATQTPAKKVTETQIKHTSEVRLDINNRPSADSQPPPTAKKTVRFSGVSREEPNDSFDYRSISQPSNDSLYEERDDYNARVNGSHALSDEEDIYYEPVQESFFDRPPHIYNAAMVRRVESRPPAPQNAGNPRTSLTERSIASSTHRPSWLLDGDEPAIEDSKRRIPITSTEIGISSLLDHRPPPFSDSTAFDTKATTTGREYAGRIPVAPTTTDRIPPTSISPRSSPSRMIPQNITLDNIFNEQQLIEHLKFLQHKNIISPAALGKFMSLKHHAEKVAGNFNELINQHPDIFNLNFLLKNLEDMGKKLQELENSGVINRDTGEKCFRLRQQLVEIGGMMNKAEQIKHYQFNYNSSLKNPEIKELLSKKILLDHDVNLDITLDLAVEACKKLEDCKEVSRKLNFKSIQLLPLSALLIPLILIAVFQVKKINNNKEKKILKNEANSAIITARRASTEARQGSVLSM